tara:strand:+ start:778 stop:1593 length:816 start_codon:yes stop_codon:yes gene_type:complete
MVEENKINSELRALRTSLDEIDARLRGIIIERAGIAARIAEVKKAHNLSVFHPSREVQILRDLSNSDLGPLNLYQIWGIWRGLINANTAIQSKLNIIIEKNIKKEHRDLILHNFGAINNLTEEANAIESMKNERNIGSKILIIPNDSSALLEIDGKNLSVIGILPQIQNKSMEPSLYIIGQPDQFHREDDIYTYKIEIDKKKMIDAEHLYTFLQDNNIEHDLKFLKKLSEDFYLLSIKGKIDSGARNIPSIDGIQYIGRYAPPIIIGEEFE